MEYFSTRNSNLNKNFKDIVMEGLSIDGGLYMPREWPKVTLHSLKNLQYDEVAFEVIHPYCNESISEESLRSIIKNTYKSFHHLKTAPLTSLEDNKLILELFYGPTFAFKDYALQFLGNLFEHFLKNEKKQISIIGATSGDTGSAAIDACKFKKNINLFMLFPHNKISEVQRKQMTTVIDKNIHCIAVEGNFDDCQKIIKNLFADKDLRKQTNLAAVNSINWARIIAQTVYYYWAALQLTKDFSKLNFIVPSGNFGNIYAANVAKKMGLNIDKLFIATNSNDILHRTISKGDMSIQKVRKTYSPSMDIQISSNFERPLFESMDYDSEKLSNLMDEFLNKGSYGLSREIIKKLKNLYISNVVSDQDILKNIKYYYNKYKYLADQHTATGLSLLKKIKDTSVPHISLACAHPSKFSSAIKKAIGKEPQYPDSLKNIFEKKEKFTILKNDIKKIKSYILKSI